ncbi:hypothetical protein SAMN04488063_3618 [Halopelagius inordinatus]|uniref:DUF7979 domain-containing protein n=1 Tax=Halopelagius inordinatus TaxID=553467 RepID=A0A1I2WN82_9EURY|nr:hypothetical protein [Halopelagius inordinatus]SFH02764.1 hypothetical protein SAMN04488063_3618 [Halopelagius inordinatus]
MDLRTLLVAALVVLAGCSGAPGSPDSDARTETESTTTEPEAELTEASGSVTNAAPNASGRASSTQDCSAVLYLEAVEHPTNETALAYGNLSAERKAEFDMALVEGSAELEESGEGYRFWVDRPYVEHDGNVYRADVAVC